MKKQDKVKKIHKILDELYPKPQKPLNHKDAYTLLIAVLLSARCTDKKVNEVTPELFKIADNPKDMSKIDVRTIGKSSNLVDFHHRSQKQYQIYQKS